MAKFKRKTVIVTHTGEKYVTNVLVGQIDYFMQQADHGAFLAVEYVDGTGHVKVIRLKRMHIASYGSA